MTHGNSLYTDELADSMIEWLSDGNYLSDWCRANKVSKTAVYAWKRDRQELEARFIEARKVGAESISDECVDIANKPLYLTRIEESAQGVKTITYDAVERSKLMIYAREQHIKRIVPNKKEKEDDEEKVSAIVNMSF